MQTAYKRLLLKNHLKMAQMELNQMNFNLSNRAEAEKKQNNIQKLLNTFTGEESQQDLNFSTDDNDVHFKKEQKKRNTIYSSTKVKVVIGDLKIVILKI